MQSTTRQGIKPAYVAVALSALLAPAALHCNAAGTASAAGSSAAASSSTGGSSEVVAEVGGKKITLDEVDKKAMAASTQPYQQLYEARRQALQLMLEDQMLEAEAKSRGVTKDKLVETEITSKQTPVTDADVEKWFNDNKERIGGRTLDQVKESIRGYLTAQGGTAVRTTFMDSLKKKNAVKISLQPPRAEVSVASNDPSMGPAGARVTIVEFSDFQ